MRLGRSVYRLWLMQLVVLLLNKIRKKLHNSNLNDSMKTNGNLPSLR